MKRWIFALLFGDVAFVGVRENLYGALFEGIEFKDSHTLGSQRLLLNNVAQMRY